MIGLKLLHTGAPERNKLDQIRGQIAAANQAIEHIRDASLPLADSMARLTKEIMPEVEYARQALLGFTRPDSLPLSDPPPLKLHHPLVAALMAEALFRPTDFEQKLKGLLTSSTKPGYSTLDRPHKAADLQVKVGQWEAAEEEEILRLEKEGFCVERRLEVPIERLIEVWEQTDLA